MNPPTIRIYCRVCGAEERTPAWGRRGLPWPRHCGELMAHPCARSVRVADGVVAFARWAVSL